MSGALHHLASALVPVAAMLLAATVVARVTLELPEATPAWRRTAAEYLEPLSLWTLGALCARAVTQALGGGLGGLELGLLLLLAAGTLLLRTAVPDADIAPASPEPPPRATPTPDPPRAAPLRPTDGTLWSGRG